MPQRQALTLLLYPVTAVTDVSIAGTSVTDYEFDPTNGRLWYATQYHYWPGYWSGYWYGGIQPKIAVTYSGGYILPDESPAALQQAVIEAVREARLFGARDPSIREMHHGDTRVMYYTRQLSIASSGGYFSGRVEDLIKPFHRLHVS